MPSFMSSTETLRMNMRSTCSPEGAPVPINGEQTRLERNAANLRASSLVVAAPNLAIRGSISAFLAHNCTCSAPMLWPDFPLPLLHQELRSFVSIMYELKCTRVATQAYCILQGSCSTHLHLGAGREFSLLFSYGYKLQFTVYILHCMPRSALQQALVHHAVHGNQA